MSPDMPAAEFGVMPENSETEAPVPQEAPVSNPQVQVARVEEAWKKEQKNERRNQDNEKCQQENGSRTDSGRDATIRQILEEFMA